MGSIHSLPLRALAEFFQANVGIAARLGYVLGCVARQIRGEIGALRGQELREPLDTRASADARPGNEHDVGQVVAGHDGRQLGEVVRLRDDRELDVRVQLFVDRLPGLVLVERRGRRGRAVVGVRR